MSILPLASVVLVVLLPSLPVIWNCRPLTLPSSAVLTLVRQTATAPLPPARESALVTGEETLREVIAVVVDKVRLLPLVLTVTPGRQLSNL